MPNRWWIYQKERFPIFKNGLLIAVFSVSAVGYSLLLRGGEARSIPIAPALIAFVTMFLVFLQLRIADEFKDFEDDARYRAYRPVPRGLVTLTELGWLGVGAGAIQLGLNLALGLPIVGLLAIVWLYLGLMSREFFAPVWLKAHPIAYLLSHMAIMPLMALYATGCDWLAAGAAPDRGLGWFLGISFLNGMAIEIGRKIRAPKDEEAGVETYTALWGKGAALVWLGAIGLSGLLTLGAARAIDFVLPIALLLLWLFTAAVWAAWRFRVSPIAATAKRIELISGLWTLGMYFGLGILPLLLQGWSRLLLKISG